MKRIVYLSLAVAIAAGLLITVAAAQSQPDSLGNYARAYRKNNTKPAARQYDNDNLPKGDKLSVVGPAPEQPADQGQDKDQDPSKAIDNNATDNTAAPADGQTQTVAQSGDQAAKSADESKKDENQKDSEAERQKMYQDWQAKITSQKAQIDSIAHELDLLQREYRLRAAAFYADAGARLRSSASWDQEDAQYKQNIAQKQKALDDAKKALDDMQEAARKAGVPSGMRE